MDTGIALFAYNRPEHFNKTITQLIKYTSHPIYIYVDGPNSKKTSILQDKIFATIEDIKKNRELIFLIKSSTNQGLRKAITNGIKNTFLYCEKIIVIEDDIFVNERFFEFIDFWLEKANKNNNILSVCGYQFSITEDYFKKSQDILSLKLPRFMPWGWATWKDKWSEFYNLEIEKVIEKYHTSYDINLLPSDLKSYCTEKEYLNNIHDTWSIPWTLVHYLSRQSCIFPSISLVENIGFDGTGVHCTSTNIFKNSNSKLYKDNLEKKSLSKKLIREINLENKLKNFLELNSDLTMKKLANNINPSSNNIEIKENSIFEPNKLKNLIDKCVDDFDFDDIHTHLFPSEFENFSLKGSINLLNYHYLLPELTGKNDRTFYNNFNNFTSEEIAKHAWESLFSNSIPISTASLGITYALDKLGIYKNKMSFDELIKAEKEINYTDKDIFEIANIRKVYMTNDPFNKKEWELFSNKNWSRERYKASIRLDTLLSDMIQKDKLFFEKNLDYLNKCIKISSPQYLSLSLGMNQLRFLLTKECNSLLKWVGNTKLPFFLMLGVRRSVNKKLKLAGDGIEDFSLDDLYQLIYKYQNISFHVSVLDEKKEHSCRVLSRKLPNMKLTGFWWFMNNKTQISESLHKRFEMLGTKHIIFYSDSRVLEQIIYKLGMYRLIIKEVLFSKLSDVQSTGFMITESRVTNLLKETSYL